MQQMAMVGGVGVEMENPEMPEELSSAAGGDFSGYNMIGKFDSFDHDLTVLANPDQMVMTVMIPVLTIEGQI